MNRNFGKIDERLRQTKKRPQDRHMLSLKFRQIQYLVMIGTLALLEFNFCSII